MKKRDPTVTNDKPKELDFLLKTAGGWGYTAKFLLEEKEQQEQDYEC